MNRRITRKVSVDELVSMALRAVRQVPDALRLHVLVAVFVATADELGMSEARILQLVNKAFGERRALLNAARQEGKMPPERPDSELPPTLDETTRPVVKTEETTSESNSASLCAVCGEGRLYAMHSSLTFPNTWHPFRAR